MRKCRPVGLSVVVAFVSASLIAAVPDPDGQSRAETPALPPNASAPPEVAVEEPPESATRVETAAAIDAGGRLTISTKVTLVGPGSDMARELLWGGIPAAREIAFSLANVQSGAPPVEPQDVSHSDPRDLSHPVEIAYRLVLAGFAPPEEKEIRVPVPSAVLRVSAYALSMVGEPSIAPVDPIPLGGPSDALEITEWTLEEGDTAVPPVGVRVDRDFGRYESTYTLHGRVFRATRSLRVRSVEFPAARRAELASFGKAMTNDLDQRVTVRLGRPRDPRTIAKNLDAGSLLELAQIAFRDRDVDLALDLLNQATRADPENANAWALLGQVRIHGRDLDGAVAALEKARELDPADTRYASSLALAYSMSRRPVDAVPALRKGLAVDPLDSGLQYRLAWILERENEWAAAAEAYERLIALAPGEPNGLIGAARAQYELGNHEAARERVGRALAHNPSIRGRLAAARVLAHPEIDPARADELVLGVMREAASVCRAVSLDHVPEDYWIALDNLAEAYRIRGEVLVERKAYDDAIKDLGVAYDIYPRDEIALGLAEAHARKGDPETGFRYFALTREARRRNAKIEIPAYLAPYVKRKYPDAETLQTALEALGKERLFQRKVETVGGPFRVPEQYPGDMGHDFKVLLLVDENGLVESHRAEGGRDPFLASALRDLPRIRFKPVGLPEAPVKTLRVVEFFYLPIKEVRAFWEFASPPEHGPEEWEWEE
jgi:tetratricopeptide (TPR) repeat protein